VRKQSYGLDDAPVGVTVTEVAMTASGYADTPTILLLSFCALSNCTDG
jgi:hypothetical protein